MGYTWYLLFCISGNNLGNGGGISVQCNTPERIVHGEAACRAIGTAMRDTAADAWVGRSSARCIRVKVPS